jgi:hypothetical protein
MALRDPQSAAIRTVGQARPFFVAYDLSDRRERLVSYNCAQRRYRSAMSFQTALFPWSAEGYPSVRIQWHASEFL